MGQIGEFAASSLIVRQAAEYLLNESASKFRCQYP